MDCLHIGLAPKVIDGVFVCPVCFASFVTDRRTGLFTDWQSLDYQERQYWIDLHERYKKRIIRDDNRDHSK